MNRNATNLAHGSCGFQKSNHSASSTTYLVRHEPSTGEEHPQRRKQSRKSESTEHKRVLGLPQPPSATRNDSIKLGALFNPGLLVYC